MSSNPNDHSERTQARELTVQFLYQCEAEKLFHYSESHLVAFAQHLQMVPRLFVILRPMVQGIFDRLPEIDATIQSASPNWTLARMAMVDRNTLRLATFEILATDTPSKVIMNEAIEIAKKFGSAESGAFVNAVLDHIARHRKTDSNS